MTAICYEGRHASPLSDPGRWVPDVINVRSCGCDLDAIVFGHRICGRLRHACQCSECPCNCHGREVA